MIILKSAKILFLRAFFNLNAPILQFLIFNNTIAVFAYFINLRDSMYFIKMQFLKLKCKKYLKFNDFLHNIFNFCILNKILFLQKLDYYFNFTTIFLIVNSFYKSSASCVGFSLGVIGLPVYEPLGSKFVDLYFFFMP
ncbi:MAG: hypothetical protein J5689_00430 [Clostridia bacterium]|nr:hypothetical protein [Clostridia bacterium]